MWKFFPILFAVLLISSWVSLANATTINFLGDIACKNDSIKNLQSIANNKAPLWGLGDYLYKCKPSAVQKNYDAIDDKTGCIGNHEYSDKGLKWAKVNFNIKSEGMFSKQIQDVLLICLNTFNGQKYDSNSPQIQQLKSTLAAERQNVNWCVVSAHEPIYTPKDKGGHPANVLLRDTLLPILKEFGCIYVDGHNHIIAYGIINGIPIAICGGGGADKDKLGSLQGFAWGTDSNGYCMVTFGDNKITLKVINPSGVVAKTFLLKENTNQTQEPETASLEIGKGMVYVPVFNGTEVINATAGLLNYTKP